MAIHPALRANFSETLPVVVTNEQGEEGRNRDEQEFSHSRIQLLDTPGVGRLVVTSAPVLPGPGLAARDQNRSKPATPAV